MSPLPAIVPSESSKVRGAVEVNLSDQSKYSEPLIHEAFIATPVRGGGGGRERERGRVSAMIDVHMQSLTSIKRWCGLEHNPATYWTGTETS